MASINDLIVRVKAETSNLTKGMNKATKDVENANKKMKKSFEQTGKATQGFQKRMSNTATAVAALQGPLGPLAGRLRSIGALFGSGGMKLALFLLALTSAIAVFRKFVQATEEGIQQMRKLEAMFKATEGAAGLSVVQIQRLSNTLAKRTLFNIKDFEDASAIMMSFKSITKDQFASALELAADIATVMGTDMRSTVMQLGKALESPAIGLTMLRRAGITFSQDQMQVIKNLDLTGRKAEAIGMALEIMNKQIGGVSAKQAQDTLSGKLDELGRKMTTFSRQSLFGTQVMEAFKFMVESTADAIPELDPSAMELEKLLERELELIEDIEEVNERLRGTGIFTPQFPEILQNTIVRLNQQLRIVKDNIKTLASKEGIGKATLRIPFIEGELFVKTQNDADRLIRKTLQLTETFGKHGAELEIVRMKQQLLNKVQKDGLILTIEERKAVEDLVEAHRKRIEATIALKDFTADLDGAVNKAFDSMENAIVGLIQGTKNLKDVMKTIMQDFIADLTVAILRMLFLKRLRDSILGKVADIAGKIFKPEIVGPPAPTGMRNTGGTVGSRTPYMVGEQGPELFIPNTSGRIQPLNKAGGSIQPQSPIVVEQHINFTTGVQATVRSEVLNLLPQIQNSTIAAVQEARLRGGTFSESFGAS